jgi:hypothetical protein
MSARGRNPHRRCAGTRRGNRCVMCPTPSRADSTGCRRRRDRERTVQPAQRRDPAPAPAGPGSLAHHRLAGRADTGAATAAGHYRIHRPDGSGAGLGRAHRYGIGRTWLRRSGDRATAGKRRHSAGLMSAWTALLGSGWVQPRQYPRDHRCLLIGQLIHTPVDTFEHLGGPSDEVAPCRSNSSKNSAAVPGIGFPFD